MSVKILPEHHLKFLSLKGGCTSLSESTLVKMPHCWISHVVAQVQQIIISTLAILFFQYDFLFDSQRPSQQTFSYVGTGLPGLNQY